MLTQSLLLQGTTCRTSSGAGTACGSTPSWPLAVPLWTPSGSSTQAGAHAAGGLCEDAAMCCCAMALSPPAVKAAAQSASQLLCRKEAFTCWNQASGARRLSWLPRTAAWAPALRPKDALQHACCLEPSQPTQPAEVQGCAAGARVNNYGSRIDLILVADSALPAAPSGIREHLRHADIEPSWQGSDHAPAWADFGPGAVLCNCATAPALASRHLFTGAPCSNNCCLSRPAVAALGASAGPDRPKQLLNLAVYT